MNQSTQEVADEAANDDVLSLMMLLTLMKQHCYSEHLLDCMN
jgi:hypothetical protein